MPGDELAIADDHAAEVLRPGPVGRGVDDRRSDVAGAKLLRLRRKAQRRVDFPRLEQSDSFAAGALDESDVLVRIEPDMRDHRRDETPASLIADVDRFSLEIAHRAHAGASEQLVAACMDTGEYQRSLAYIETRQDAEDVDDPHVEVASGDRRILRHLDGRDVLQVAETL